MRRKALGKGLRSLIPEAPTRIPTPSASPEETGAVDGAREIDLDRIRPNPRQPRESMDAEKLDSLARSLKEQGFLQPVVVRRSRHGEYELVAGERRWRAAQKAGLPRIPAIVKEVPEERLLEYALIENLQREDLNPIEEARAYRTLLEELGLTQQQIAERVGKQRATVANALRLLSLPETVQNKLRSGEVSMGHARAMVSLEDAALQEALAERVSGEGLSVRQVESLVARAREAPEERAQPPQVRDPNVVSAEETLQRALGTKVRIQQGSSGAGRIELHFYTSEELDRLFEMLRRVARTPA